MPPSPQSQKGPWPVIIGTELQLGPRDTATRHALALGQSQQVEQSKAQQPTKLQLVARNHAVKRQKRAA
jgi:hypothetical protein